MFHQDFLLTGPGSSDSSEEGLSPHEGAVVRVSEASDSEGLYEDVRSVTPHPPNTSTNEDLMETSIPPETISDHNLDYVGDMNIPPLLQMPSKDNRHSNSDENFQGSNYETSDTDLRINQWKYRRFESDLSTAPFSSETSDMDTSGNERILATDNGAIGNRIGQSKPPPQVQHRQINSESSGDEIAKRAHDVRIIPRPLPKPAILQSNRALPKAPPLAKKPLHLTKSSPMASKLSISSVQPQSKTSNAPSRNRSSLKGGIPSKPKPPVPSKPKPDVRPKPVITTTTQQRTTVGLSNGLC